MSAGVQTTEPPSTGAASWSRRHPAKAAALCVLAYLIIATAGGISVAAAQSPIAKIILVTIAAAGALALSLLLVLSICRVPMRPSAEVACVFAMMVVFALARPAVFAIIGKALGNAAAGRRLEELFSVLPGQQLLGNAALIVWAAFLGKLVSRIIKEGKLFLPIAVVASIADIFTVFWGPVKAVTTDAPEVAEAFSASAPAALPPELAAPPIIAAVGIGDFLFLAVFLAAAIRHSMATVKTMWAVLALMLIAPLAFYVWPEEYGMPGLPFVAAAALWANWRHLKFTREEGRALAFAGALVAAAAAGIWILLHR